MAAQIVRGGGSALAAAVAALPCRATPTPPNPGHAMSYDPRTIAFLAEVLYPPIQLRTDQVQGIHNTLYRQPGLGYQNFQVAQDGIHLTNLATAPGQVSSVSYLPDRLVLREELRGTTIEDFATRVVNVATVSFQALGIGTSLAQQFVLRSLVQPKHARDGREFLAQRLLQEQAQALAAFGRPLQSLGLRFLFPPAEGGRDTFHLRIESWPHDPRSLWLENTGSFAQPTTTENLPSLAGYLYSTYRFLTGPACDYLGRFDQP